MFIIEGNGISIYCDSSNYNECHIDVGYYSNVDKELYDMLNQNEKNAIDSILNNRSYDNRMKRIELNYYINKNVSQETLKKYSKILSNRINKQVQDNLRKSGIYDPCFPFCNGVRNELNNLSDKITQQVHNSLKKSGIFDPCFPFCDNSNPMFKNYKRRNY